MDCIYRTESHTLLMKEVEKFKSTNINVNAISVVGNPREEIENTLVDLKPDLVIIGSRCLGPVDRVFLGSVSEHLIHNLSIPILVVPQ
jgi:nucleotide-binding universal stress UspA family protein